MYLLLHYLRAYLSVKKAGSCDLAFMGEYDLPTYRYLPIYFTYLFSYAYLPEIAACIGNI